MINRLTRGAALVRTLGPGWAIFRVRYAARRRFGLLARATPLTEWPRVPALPRTQVFVAPRQVGPGCLKTAAEISAGTFRLFSFHTVAAGFPPDWHRNQISGESAGATEHWSRLGDFAFGDIKAVWELSRFTWAFDLARAYAKTGDEHFAEKFWLLLADWMRCNPPNRGPNWMCGQEASFRLMAVAFACDVLADARATSTERKEAFASLVIATAERIAANLDYALSQSNNHGVSEAVGLVTAALLAPGHAKAPAWYRRGCRALDNQVTKLVYDDGAFSQHSATYHRVLMHDLLWFIAFVRAHGRSVSETVLQGATRALSYIDSLMTESTGAVPLYGASDGATILPLADADYLDFRPVVQAGHAVLTGQRPLPPGPWDELADWLTGKQRAERAEAGRLAPLPRQAEPKIHHPQGGCLIWRQGESRLFFRCPTSFRHRPSQADLLHVDLEWRGFPVAMDAGTYSYNSPGPLGGGLKEARLHNTVTFDGREPMEKISRFLYLPWPTGTAGWKSEQRFTAEHDGWGRLGFHHVRSIEAEGKDGFVVTDELVAERDGVARVHWLLPDRPHRLSAERSELLLETPAGELAITWNFPGAIIRLVRADPETDEGWMSPHYFQAQPALALTFEMRFSGTIRGSTRFAPTAKAA